MEKIGKWALVRIILIIVGLLYGTLHHFDQIPKGFNEGFTILLLLLLVELAVEVLIDLRKKNDLDQAASLLPRASLNGKVYAAIKHELDNAVKVEKDRVGFRVVHNTLALSSYDTFWKFLIQEQDPRKAPLHLKVIHSCDFEIWVNHPFTKSLLERHKLFTAKGGIVERILCGNGSSPDEKIRKAASNMKDAGVTVFYHRMNEEGIGHNYSWDFLYVVERDLSVIWASFTNRPRGVIGEAIYLKSGEYQDQNLNLLWAEIRDHSIDFPFEEGSERDAGVS